MEVPQRVFKDFSDFVELSQVVASFNQVQSSFVENGCGLQQFRESHRSDLTEKVFGHDTRSTGQLDRQILLKRCLGVVDASVSFTNKVWVCHDQKRRITGD